MSALPGIGRGEIRSGVARLLAIQLAVIAVLLTRTDVPGIPVRVL